MVICVSLQKEMNAALNDAAVETILCTGICQGIRR